jgi:hypothetical protein
MASPDVIIPHLKSFENGSFLVHFFTF